MKKLILLLILLMIPVVGKSQSGPLTGTISFQIGTSLPATCMPSPVLVFYLYSGGTYTGYNCTAINTWTASGGGSGTGPVVFVTDPPYNAKCDGSTDDSVALQAAFNHGGTVALPNAVQYPVFVGISQCNFATPLVLPFNTTLQMNGGILEYTGAGGVGVIALTINAQSTVINGSLALNTSVGPLVGAESISSVFIYGLYVYDNLTPPSNYTSYYGHNLQESMIYVMDTDGPVVLQTDAGINFTGVITVASSYFGLDALADFPSMLTLDLSTVTNINFVSSNVDVTQSSTGCAICIVNSVAGQSKMISFGNVNVSSSMGYAGVALKTTQTGGAPSPLLSGSISNADYLGGTPFSGAWKGVLQFGDVTYRGSAATLTYACTGGTQAGLIYTNNSSCTGGTAVATGDSVQ